MAGPGRGTTITVVHVGSLPVRIGFGSAAALVNVGGALRSLEVSGRRRRGAGAASRRRPGERKQQPPRRSQRCSPTASAALLPPHKTQHIPVHGVDPWCHGTYSVTPPLSGGVVRRSQACPPDVGRCSRCPVPCATTRSTDTTRAFRNVACRCSGKRKILDRTYHSFESAAWPS